MGISTSLFVYGAFALVLLVAGMLVGGIANTFFWCYWPHAYLRRTGGAPVAAAAA